MRRRDIRRRSGKWCGGDGGGGGGGEGRKGVGTFPPWTKVRTMAEEWR